MGGVITHFAKSLKQFILQNRRNNLINVLLTFPIHPINLRKYNIFGYYKFFFEENFNGFWRLVFG